MFGYEYIANASIGTKTVIILCIFIIIGLSIRNWDEDTIQSEFVLNREIRSDYNGPHVGKKLVPDGRLDNIILSSTANTEDDINECADICTDNTKCSGFNYIGNKCDFIAGTIAEVPELTTDAGSVAFKKNFI